MEVYFLENFIYPESVILIPVLYLIGVFLNRTPNVQPWVTPWVQVALGVIFCIAYYGLKIQAVVQGILVAGAATLIKDLVQTRFNFSKKDNGDHKK